MPAENNILYEITTWTFTVSSKVPIVLNLFPNEHDTRSGPFSITVVMTSSYYPPLILLNLHYSAGKHFDGKFSCLHTSGYIQDQSSKWIPF